MSTAPSRVETWQVGITYCDGRVVLQDFGPEKGVRTAVLSYAEMLAEALAPSVSLPNARHSRMVTLIGYDAGHLLVHHVHSGLIGCSHRNR